MMETGEVIEGSKGFLAWLSPKVSWFFTTLLSNPYYFIAFIVIIIFLCMAMSHMYDIFEGNMRHRGLKTLFWLMLLFIIVCVYFMMYKMGSVPTLESYLQ